MKVTGSCHCGAVTFEAELAPDKVGICHCTDCQKLSASAYRVLALVDGASLRMTGAAPQRYVKTGDIGNRRVQAFCGTCGSAIYACADEPNPPIYNLRLGVIDQRRDLEPAFECWTASALPWVEGRTGIRKFDGNPA